MHSIIEAMRLYPGVCFSVGIIVGVIITLFILSLFNGNQIRWLDHASVPEFLRCNGREFRALDAVFSQGMQVHTFAYFVQRKELDGTWSKGHLLESTFELPRTFFMHQWQEKDGTTRYALSENPEECETNIGGMVKIF